MAYAFMRTMVQTRSKGHTATGAVCYRMGLAAESTIPGADGEPRHFDYTRRTGIAATGSAAPPGTDPSWRDPLTWAHRIEAVDKRKNSRQCRDDIVGIPVELVDAGAAEEAIQAYADRLAAEHQTVVHFALHRPDRGGKNHHAHVLYPGRHVNGMTFARKRDRTQDNPGRAGGPELIAQHKAFWSEICRGRGIELDWTSEAPGHHLGPALCAIKRDRLVEQTRETIRDTVAASTPGEPVPGERTLQAVAEVATRVNDGLTVTEMLERELEEALHGRPDPVPVPAPAPFQPEVLPAARIAPEVVPAVRTIPEVLPPCRQMPQVLPPVRQPPAVSPPQEITTRLIFARIGKEHPDETMGTWLAVEDLLAEQRQQTRAHEQARSAAQFLAGAALVRVSSRLPAPPNKIQRLADWLLNCVQRVLEHWGMKPQHVLEERPPPAPEKPPRQPGTVRRGEVDGVSRREPPAPSPERVAAKRPRPPAPSPERVAAKRPPRPPAPSPERVAAKRPPRPPAPSPERVAAKRPPRPPAPSPERVAAKRPRQPELSVLVDAMENELQSRAKWYRDKYSVVQILNSATGDITGKVRHWKSASLAEKPRILDRADLLCMSGWMVGRARFVSPIPPAQETIRAAAREIAADPKLNDWQRTLAAGVAFGEVRTHHDTSTSVAEEEQQTTDHLMAAKREAAGKEANQQTTAALKEWNAKSKWLRGRKPEPVRPAEPDPPTPAEIRNFRQQEVFQTIKEAMRKDILEKFSEPIRDVVDRAFERGKLPVSRPVPPRTPTRGRDPGLTR